MISVLFFLSLSSCCFSSQPNFILINMDDMGWGDLGVMGHPTKETPNIDRMSSEGILFPQFYTSAAICSPSRASLLTGRLPLRTGFYQTTYPGRNAYTPQEMVGGIQDQEMLIPEILATVGYRSKLVGKWHLGHRAQYLPLQHGFQEWFGAPNCHFKYNVSWRPGPNIPVYNNDKMQGRYYQQFDIDIKTGHSNYSLTLLEHVLDYISRDDSGSPYFLYFAPDATHAPHYSSVKFSRKSSRGTFYGDALMELDWAVGQIMDYVKSKKSFRDTLIIFTSDNGAALVDRGQGGSNGPLMCGKQTTFEGGMRTPTIAWWAGVGRGSVSQYVGTHMDILPTFAALAGASLPSSIVLDGQSFHHVLLGNNKQDKNDRPVFFYRGNLLYAVRWTQYKAHFWTWTTPPEELKKGIDHCPGASVPNVTTTDMRHHGDSAPVIFHLGRDPGETFPVSPATSEYRTALANILKIVKDHRQNMIPGEPQLEICDASVMNWSPAGCEELGLCLPIPKSKPYKCFWPH